MPSGSDSNLEELDSFLAEARRRLADSRGALAAAQVDMREAEQRVRLLEELIALERGEGHIAHERPAWDVVDATVRMLDESGEPMRIGEIRTGLVDAGVPLPGKGADANLIAKFQSSPQIKRVSRGVYDIARENMKPALLAPDGSRVEICEALRIGAGEDNDLVVSDAPARLAELRAADQQVVVRATDGETVSVNERAVSERNLRQGDTISLGHQAYRFTRF